MRGNRSGLIAYVGEVDFKPDEVMVGVVLDEVGNLAILTAQSCFQPQGKHDGSVDGKR
jgi:hypothetical protein